VKLEARKRAAKFLLARQFLDRRKQPVEIGLVIKGVDSQPQFSATEAEHDLFSVEL
jgi:hypothetical protein